MKITKMRIKGKKLSQETLDKVAQELSTTFEKHGFITQVSVINQTTLNIGLGSWSCFKVNTDLVGYNAVVPCYNSYGHLSSRVGIKGYKLTTVPTWDQRVEFNNLINACLDKHNISASIKSGGVFTVRKGMESYNERDWVNAIDYNEYHLNRVVKLTQELVEQGRINLKKHKGTKCQRLVKQL